MPEARDAGWRRGAGGALAGVGQPGVMCTEGAIGLWQGLAAGSIALTGWALGSAVEGLASIVVIWRFTGVRALSQAAEHRARRAVARFVLAAGPLCRRRVRPRPRRRAPCRGHRRRDRPDRRRASAPGTCTSSASPRARTGNGRHSRSATS
jgi:hypothetical protein